VPDDGGELLRFAENLRQEVLSAAELEDSERLRAQVFTEMVIEELCNSGDLDDGAAVYQRARGIEVSGYAVSEDNAALDIFTTIYTGAVPPITVPKADIETHFARLLTFLDRSMKGYYKELEEANPVFDMCLRIYEAQSKLKKVRFFCFTDGVSTAKLGLKQTESKLDRSLHLWDIERLYRAATSGADRAAIDIDLVARFGRGIPCLTDTETSEYHTMLAIVPGEMLARLYGAYGSRLLEFNVRSFLQARGKVNKGIRRTILEEPRRFLAYNNGIAATASEVSVTRHNGGSVITGVKDLQIVNGGQTTASLFNAARSDGADLSKIAVQMKLTVVEPDLLQSFVPLISRYANSQNKVNEADFAANESYHVQLEMISRTVWAPPAAGTQRQTRWFYERARGQYQDLLAGAETRAKRDQLKAINPTNQKFTKTDLAKFENTFAELPYVVSLGAEKNFREFVIRMSEGARIDVDQTYFERVVAHAIVFRQTEKIVSALRLGAYRANVVTYTLALINRRTAGQLDLGRIWREQAIGPGLVETIQFTAPRVLDEITRRAAGRNVTEWCKREECWHHVASLHDDLSPKIYKEVLSQSADQQSRPGVAAAANLARVVATPPETWKAIALWSKDSGHLLPWQRNLCVSLARLLSEGRRPTETQAVHGVLLLDDAERKGFQRP
jgi:hypothetical protein